MTELKKKKMSKEHFDNPKVAFMQLSSCWGCHQSLLNAHAPGFITQPEFEIVYWPAVVDYKLKSLQERDDNSILVGYVEGVVRTKQDMENLLLLRKKCFNIAALGACACYGSVKGLANLFDIEELTNRKFKEVETITDEDPKVPTENVPGFEDKIINIKDIIDVDIFIPGCPPSTDNIRAAAQYLRALTGSFLPSRDKGKCVCDVCNLSKKGCLLDKNIMCFGSITAAGCSTLCPNNGDVCYGCFRYSNAPGPRMAQLRERLEERDTLSLEDVAFIQHFLTLYLNAANLECFYFRRDLLQRLVYEPESYKVKYIKTKKNEIKQLLDITATVNKDIDEIIGLCLYLLKDCPNFKFSTKTVCSHCSRVIVDKVPSRLKRDYEGLPSMDKCFLEEGYICMGPATKAGCGTLCPNKANAPCLGCYGPPVGVKEQGAKYIGMLGSLTADKDPEEVSNFIKDPAGLFNRFTLADSTLKYKRHDKIGDE